MKDINARLERIEPQIRSSDGVTGNFAAGESKPASLNPKKSSPKAKSSSRETSLFGGQDALTSNFIIILIFVHMCLFLFEKLLVNTSTYVHTFSLHFFFSKSRSQKSIIFKVSCLKDSLLHL